MRLVLCWSQALQTVLNVDSSAKQETTLAKTLMEIYSNIRSEVSTPTGTCSR